jgi:hypothetical protein
MVGHPKKRKLASNIEHYLSQWILLRWDTEKNHDYQSPWDPCISTLNGHQIMSLNVLLRL